MVSVNNKHNVSFGLSKMIKMRNTVLPVLSFYPDSETKGILFENVLTVQLQFNH